MTRDNLGHQRGEQDAVPSVTGKSFRGPVLDGPWRGDIIEADSTPIPYVNDKGQYGFSDVAKGWYWIEPA